MGDFVDGSNSDDDYEYDDHGSLIVDKNKHIVDIHYNHLNLPQKIFFSFPQGNGNIEYVYSAAGAKLKKVVTDSSVSPVKVTATLYLGPALYKNDSLLFVVHEEGRYRISLSDTGRFVSDYFLRDHLGNVRMVLTDENRVSAYPAATMESASANTEELLYSNISQTRENKPAGYPTDTTYTNPNDKVAKLSGSGNKIGPSIVLKVMAGDMFNLRVSSWYRQNGTTPGTNVNPLSQILASLADGVTVASAGKLPSAQTLTNGFFDPAVIQYLGTQSSASSTKPKAFVNWVLLDERFNLVSECSGFEQVGANEELKVHIRSELPLSKNGYLYVYVSNETPNIDVFFDNLQVTHIHGALIEETHYYPYGLTMAAISSKAFGVLENRFKYNAGTEFNSDLGLDLYETPFRGYDPQIARFLQIDPLAEKGHNWTGYGYCYGNPIMFVDPYGLDTISDPFNPGKALEGGDVLMFGGNMYHYNDETGSWASVGWLDAVTVSARRGSRSGPYLTSRQYASDLMDLLNSSSSGHWDSYMEHLKDLSAAAAAAAEKAAEVERQKAAADESANKFVKLLTPWDKANIIMGGSMVSVGLQGELMDYAVRSRFKSNTSWWDYNKLRGTQKTWRQNFVLGKEGAALRNGMTALGKTVFAVQVGGSLINTGVAFYNDDPNKWGVAGKASLDITIGAISVWGGPVGWAIGGIYFIGDAAGWWGDWGKPAEAP